MQQYDFAELEVKLLNFEKDLVDLHEIQIGAVKISNWIQKSTGKKFLRYQYPNSLKKDEALFKKEILNISTTVFPAILPFLGYHIEGDNGYLFFELKEKGSLNKIINNNDNTTSNLKIDNTSKLIISYGVACAIEFLHKHNVIYEELKPIKIFLDSEFHPFLSLFHIKKLTSSDLSKEFRVDVEELFNVAPETFKESKISSKTDVYSYGILLYNFHISQSFSKFIYNCRSCR